MSRIAPVAVDTAEGRTADLLGGVKKALGIVPNLYATAARSLPVLEGLVALNGALATGGLPPRIRHAIALAVAQRNGCDYCVSAHSFIAKNLKLTDADIAAAREAQATDARTGAILAFAAAIVDRHGQVTDAEIAAARAAGLTDAEILEVVGNVVVNVFTNFINNVADTDIDFPRAATTRKAA